MATDQIIEIKIALYRGANAPPIKVPLPLADYTGSDIWLVFTPRGGPSSFAYKISDGTLTLAPPDDEGRSDGVIIAAYGELAEGLPLGQRSLLDVFRVVGAAHEKLGAGSVWVGGVGEFRGTASTQASGLPMQGPALFNFLDEWEPGAYQARDAVTHLGSTWYATRATDEEPGPDALDWGVLVEKGATGDITPEAAAALALARAAAGVEIEIPIYMPGGIPGGGYYGDRHVRAPAVVDNLYAEIIAGMAAVTFFLNVNDLVGYGPWTAAPGVPVDVSGVGIVVAAGDRLTVQVTADSTSTEMFIKVWGALS